jgi:hypothetical protein
MADGMTEFRKLFLEQIGNSPSGQNRSKMQKMGKMAASTRKLVGAGYTCETDISEKGASTSGSLLDDVHPYLRNFRKVDRGK